ncbi:hypothetical protein V6C03_02475 [Methyloligella sp. 2.7D]|uniref:hypothetical protein n=1 Tax=unclassified Methyloligella TaxID=2625955 RepID=UPI00157C7A92|nr:hypothetical protein [Methyloligella sp. GL2]QKP76506.1 hypothetical protein HT051_02945 [Methyloligella sp. GL2]
MTSLPANFYHVRLELAREPEHPTGEAEYGYDVVAPLDEMGKLDADNWRAHKDDCRVRRFRPNEDDEIGKLARKPGGSWYFDYAEGDEDDESGYRLGEEHFIAGEYVSVREDDGEMHTYVVKSVVPLS